MNLIYAVRPIVELNLCLITQGISRKRTFVELEEFI